MNKIKYYWQRSGEKMSWVIGYRKKKEESILSDLETPFNTLDLPSGTWGADPFLFEYNGDTYIFFEWFFEKKEKGVIACIKLSGDKLSAPEIVLEEPFHLSFPCVFSYNGTIYMIPETGSMHNIVLYKCVDFPSKWEKEKELLSGVNSSDTIVWNYNGNMFVIASMLHGNASTASNKIYLLDMDGLELRQIGESSEYSNEGYRNAGFIFEDKKVMYRPGQNCENNQYGKGLIFWKILLENGKYNEHKEKAINITDLSINNDTTFCGVHTYNLSQKYEVIDLKILKQTSFMDFCKNRR